MGLQLFGPAWKEADLLFAASALESSIRSQKLQALPKISFDVLYGAD